MENKEKNNHKQRNDNKKEKEIKKDKCKCNEEHDLDGIINYIYSKNSQIVI